MPWRKEKVKGALLPREVDPFTRMRHEFDMLFNRVFGMLPMAYVEEWEKPVWNLEVVEEGKEIVVRAEAPGFEVADFDVRLTGELLTIVAEHKEAKEKTEKNGRAYVRLERAVTLPPYADPEKVTAVYRNGVLELRIAKLPEVEGKKIEVKT
jgi:HSP20 family protein